MVIQSSVPANHLIGFQVTRKVGHQPVITDGHFNLPRGVCVGMYGINILTLSHPRVT